MQQRCFTGKNGQNVLGTMTYSNKDKYVGEWEDGFKHGKGTMTWSDGNTYTGEFKADYASGQGIMTLCRRQNI